MAIDVTKLSYRQVLFFLDEVYQKCTGYEKVIHDSRREMVSAFNVAASDVMSALEEGRQTQKIKKKNNVFNKTGNPIVSALEKATQALELSQERSEWQVIFYELIAEIKQHEEERYSTSPFLYKIFENAYADLSKRHFLPVVWNHYTIKWMLEYAHYREDDFFKKNERNLYRESVFNQLFTIFSVETSKAEIKQQLIDLLVLVKKNDNLLGDFLASVIENWTTKGILADSIEDTAGNTYSGLLK